MCGKSGKSILSGSMTASRTRKHGAICRPIHRLFTLRSVGDSSESEKTRLCARTRSSTGRFPSRHSTTRSAIWRRMDSLKLLDFRSWNRGRISTTYPRNGGTGKTACNAMSFSIATQRRLVLPLFLPVSTQRALVLRTKNQQLTRLAVLKEIESSIDIYHTPSTNARSTDSGRTSWAG